MFWLRNKKISFLIRTLNLSPVFNSVLNIAMCIMLKVLNESQDEGQLSLKFI